MTSHEQDLRSAAARDFRAAYASLGSDAGGLCPEDLLDVVCGQSHLLDAATRDYLRSLPYEEWPVFAQETFGAMQGVAH